MTPPLKLLAIDQDTATAGLVRALPEFAGARVHQATTSAAAMQSFREDRPDVVLLDPEIEEGGGLALCGLLGDTDPDVPIVLLVAGGGGAMSIEGIQRGAVETVAKPLAGAELVQAVRNAVESRTARREAASRAPWGEGELLPRGGLIGRSPAIQRVFKAVGRVAVQNIGVLIRGETGTGKELVARAVHQYSPRKARPFVAVNCAAIPEALLESELFGYEKGAFTGADRRHTGKFESCDGGTLFFDEVGDMAPRLQAKLLRVLQDGSFYRVGGNDLVRVDVRLVAATNRNLEEMVETHEFREDLLYRLSGFTINLPPLRDRVGDIELLLDFYRRQANQELDRHVKRFDDAALDYLRRYRWPGNVRELQGVVRQAIVDTTGDVVHIDALPASVSAGVARAAAPDGNSDADPCEHVRRVIEDGLRRGTGDLYDEVLSWIEPVLFRRVLEHTHGKVGEAARLLGLSRTTFRARLRAHRIASDDGDGASHGP